MEAGWGTNPKSPHQPHGNSCQRATPGLCHEGVCAGHTQHCQPWWVSWPWGQCGTKDGAQGDSSRFGDPGTGLGPLGLPSHSDLILHVGSQPFLAHSDGRGAANNRGFTAISGVYLPQPEHDAQGRVHSTGSQRQSRSCYSCTTAIPIPLTHLKCRRSQQPVSLLASRKVPCPLPISQECKHSAVLPQCTQYGGERQRSSALLLNMVLLLRGRRQPHALLAGGGGKETWPSKEGWQGPVLTVCSPSPGWGLGSHPMAQSGCPRDGLAVGYPCSSAEPSRDSSAFRDGVWGLTAAGPKGFVLTVVMLMASAFLSPHAGWVQPSVRASPAPRLPQPLSRNKNIPSQSAS